MTNSIERFLDQIATRGTWYGGGSAAALACALSAALMEKLASQPRLAKALRPIRVRCIRLIHEDAEVFARVIRAASRQNRSAVQGALKAAVNVPKEIYLRSQQLLHMSRQIRRTTRPRYQVDLQCAIALARASGFSARALITTNLAWLADPAYSRRVRRAMAQPR